MGESLKINLQGPLWSSSIAYWEQHAPGVWEKLFNAFYGEEESVEVVVSLPTIKLAASMHPLLTTGYVMFSWGDSYVAVCSQMGLQVCGNIGSFIPWCVELGTPGLTVPVFADGETFPGLMQNMVGEIHRAVLENTKVFKKTQQQMRKRRN